MSVKRQVGAGGPEMDLIAILSRVSGNALC